MNGGIVGIGLINRDWERTEHLKEGRKKDVNKTEVWSNIRETPVLDGERKENI